jgi:2-(1,2-epoxy-1,2-dihydrophenyl)acetyl-CoA isomerase
MTQPVLLTRQAGVAHLRFNRPDRLNAVDLDTARAFRTAVEAIAADASIRAVVVGGEGRAFGAGGDLATLREDPARQAAELIAPMHDALALMGELPVPFVASLHGVVAGGSLSVALACDLAVATSGTKFNLSYVKIGATCDGGATWTLPRRCGLGNALAIALLGETLDAAEAHRLGLVQRLVDGESADAAATAWAEQLAAGPTQAIGRMKRLLRSSYAHDFQTQLSREHQEFVANAESVDFREGITAFFDRRKPAFSGR